MKEENPDTTYTVPVPSGKAGQRLDSFLAGALEELSRTRLKNLIEEGRVKVQTDDSWQVASDPSRKVLENQEFVIDIPPLLPAIPEAQSIPLEIIHEDDDVIVINKPCGLVVHPAPGTPDGTLVNALLGHARDSKDAGGLSGIGGVERPEIVHRLDKGTSGLMVIAKNDAAHHTLSQQFADRSLQRAYYALVWGVPKPSQGEVTGNIGRSPGNRKKMAVVSRGGKSALTRFKVVKSFGTSVSMVECRLATGRTHQIRVHMASIGHPVIGDPLYGGGGKTNRRELSKSARALIETLDHQVLHAYLLGFRVGKYQNEQLYEGELPKYFNELIEKLESG